MDSLSHIPADAKMCAACKVVKPIACFSNDKTTKDGRDRNCKQCHSERKKRRTAERRAIREAEQALLPKGKTCSVCNTWFSLEHFYKGNRKCLPCYRAQVKLRTSQPGYNRDVYLRYRDNPKNQEALRKTYLRHLEYVKERRAKDPEYVKYLTKMALDSRRRHKETAVVIRNRRKTKQSLAGGHFTTQQWKDLCSKYNHKCLCCGKEKPLTVDHIIPISRGGSSDISNIQPLCQSCNSRKHARIIDYRS